MEITSTAAHASKSPEPIPDTPIRIQPAKPVTPCTNGVLKRHRQQATPAAAVVVTYRECLKNHAASLGGHALDGCGEFMPSPSATFSDPTSLKCAACGCHRNFHRRDPDDSSPPPLPSATHAIEYHPHHRHHPPPPRSPSSASPPPISSSYAPHMLLALSSGLPSGPEKPPPVAPHPTAMISPNPGSRKRFRTKFSQTQKDRMLEFAEQVGWKIQKRDEDLIQEFCSEVGVDRNVLKVWMHNNKSTFGKRETNQNTGHGSAGGGGGGNGCGGESHMAEPHMGTNGSSSSS
ncbi:zinc-finger homeodomain protein 10-like [Punica granatum]|uniref:ZF-HD dimerization-type domain-containing protein n=2 Tax=Punica granatum TaxID=22663 RepID=A0A218WMC9_PUNGR|nr:zinc-finger homeodomain protein 10-like [Punica granatum]OWM73955.1 hypothetical protein CDL15_Pgr022226 [Punica granatum]PKI45055.1 hypothetical protein CRG98_034556 [Punica granatum]